MPSVQWAAVRIHSSLMSIRISFTLYIYAHQKCSSEMLIRNVNVDDDETQYKYKQMSQDMSKNMTENFHI